MMSRHFALRSELSGAIAKILPHAKNQFSGPDSFFNQFVTDIYIYIHIYTHINRVLIVSIYIYIYIYIHINRVLIIRMYIIISHILHHYHQKTMTHHPVMTSSLPIKISKIDKFGDFSCNINYSSRTDVFRDVISLIIDQCGPRTQRRKMSASRAAHAYEARLY